MWHKDTLLESLNYEKFRGKSSKFIFNNMLSSEARRPKDSKETAALALFLTMSDDLEAHLRTASYVVFIYKCIENSQHGLIEENFLFFNELEEILEKSINYNVNFSGVREDCRQVYLSLLTVKWHAEIFLNISPIPTLMKIENFTKKIPVLFNSVTFTQNIGRGLLLYSYILFLQKKQDSARKTISNLWEYFCSSCIHLADSTMPSSSHLGDFSKLSTYVQHSKAGIEWMDEVRKRPQYWDGEVIARLVSRVRVKSHPHYYKILLDYLQD